jgi:hypothetical protein
VRSRRPLLIGAVCLVIAGGTLVWAATGSRSTDCNAFSFDRAEWRERPSHRHGQAVALLRCKLLRNESKKSVRFMLGRPDPEESTTGAWTYYLGSEGGAAAVDAEYLDISFKRGHVIRAMISSG